MDEVRSDTFCVGSNSIAWRDSHQFSFELNGLVLQYMANPALQDSLTGGITNTATCEYEAPRRTGRAGYYLAHPVCGPALL